MQARDTEGRINAAFETIARIGIDAELAARLRNIQRIPQRGFNQHIGCRLIAARCFTAHNACNGFNTFLVGNHHHAGLQLMHLAVQSMDGFPLFGGADMQRPMHFGGIEDMQGASKIKGQIIGDIHQGIDRAQANRFQAALHPVGAGAVLDAAHTAQGKSGREIFFTVGKIKAHRNAAGFG